MPLRGIVEWVLPDRIVESNIVGGFEAIQVGNVEYSCLLAFASENYDHASHDDNRYDEQNMDIPRSRDRMKELFEISIAAYIHLGFYFF